MKKDATFKWDDKDFVNFYTDSANLIVLERQRSIRILIEIAAFHFPSLADLHFLELGCGEGLITKLIHDKSPNNNFYLVDASEEMLSRAKANLSGSKSNISFHHLPLVASTTLPFSSRSGRSTVMVWYSTRSFLVFTGYARHVGEVVSTSSLNSNLDGVMTAETPDTVFSTNASAYRLRSVTQVLALGISRAANDHSSLNLAVDRLLAHADGGNNYYASMLSMSYVHAF